MLSSFWKLAFICNGKYIFCNIALYTAAPSHSGKYKVKAENAAGEAQCIADFIILEPEPQTLTQTEHNLQMMTHVVFKDVREERIQVS
jgi:hypothetical protein